MIGQVVLEVALLVWTPTVSPAEPGEPPATTVEDARPTRTLQLSLENAPPGLGEKLERALLQYGITTSLDERDGSLVVTIRPWSGAGIEGFGYDLDLSRDQERVGEVFSQVCVGCSIDDLALEVAGHVATMAEALPPYQEEPIPEPPKEASPPAPIMVPPPLPARRSLGRPLLAAGIPTLSVGTVLLGVGIGLLAKGEVVTRSPMNAQYLDITDYRPPGRALLVSGGVVIVVGAVLTVVGGRHRRTERGGHARGLVPRLTF